MKRLLSGSHFCVALAAIVTLCSASQSFGQVLAQQQSVGGIAIDGNGAVAAATVEAGRELAELRRKALTEVPADLEPYTELRAVSLKHIEAELEGVGWHCNDGGDA